MASEKQRCRISRVPDHIRGVNPALFAPAVFPIGPYHAHVGAGGAPERARRLKEQCLDEVVRLSGSKRGDFLAQMRSLVKRAREYYTEDIDMEDEAMAEMLLLDGSFVLASLHGTARLTRGSSTCGETESSDCANSFTCLEESDEENQVAVANTDVDSWHHFNVARDLFLVENQIPFFVVQKIYELLVKNHPRADRRAVSAVEAYVRDVMAVYAKGDGEAAALQPHHLLHLSHMYLRPIEQLSPWSDDGKCSVTTVGRLRRATQYRGLMVRFRKLDIGGKAAPRSILDLAFRGGALEIPRLEIDGDTWRQMANLVLLEQASPHVGLYVTAYCAFMSQLAGTADDVALLCESGIIEHHLGGDGDVVEGFRKLCDGIIFDANDDAYNYLRPVYQALEEHCRRRTPKLLRWLRAHANCPNPWMVLGVLTIITLLCFIVQQLHHATLRNPAT
ncbi:uncharacterized protein LOC102704091 [Oryza brachyantha]|nr:uncharacterized protein LOC102704091 [Oryza brachyantha]